MLVVGGVTDRLGPDDFPDPVGTSVIVVFGLALLGVGALLWRLADTIDLRTLAMANLGTAALAIVWRVGAHGFSDAGEALVVATTAALTVLAAAQVKASGAGGKPAPLNEN